MNKIEALNKLRTEIKSNGTIKYHYVENGCFCAIGHLMKVCGIDVPTFFNETWEDKNTINIGTLTCSLEDDEEMKKLLSIFNEVELEEIQTCNDEYVEEEERNKELISLIDKMIEREESK